MRKTRHGAVVMASIKRLQQNWESLAQADTLWAICSDPSRRGGNWNEEEFFATGEKEIGAVVDYVRALGVQVDFSATALDFGCGVGRLTRALAARFTNCWGVDISPTMITKAQALNRHIGNCRFRLNEADELREFADGHFGFVYSSIVLQHIQPSLVRKYLRELVRVLKPGGALVFQVTDRFKAGLMRRVRRKLALRRRIRGLLGRAHADFGMYCVPESTVRRILGDHGARIQDVVLTNSADPDFNGNLRFLEREPRAGFISKQYCVVKDV